MSWLNKLKPAGIRTDAAASKKRNVPEGLWEKCDHCGAALYRPELEENLEVCPKCGHHMPIRARARLLALLDPGSTREIAPRLGPVDVLKFRDSKKYADRIKATQKASGERDALVAMQGLLKGRPLVASAFDFAFMGGSMGSVVGERFALAAETALEDTGETDAMVVMQGSVKSVPLVIAAFEFEFMGGSMGSVVGERFVRGARAALEARTAFVSITASGGARMQEGLFSLLQMAKTTAVLTQLAEARIPYISVLTDPTMGGASASFCFLGDVVIAEPRALIGFAGPRVIEQTMQQKLPEGFQRSEFLLQKGAIDMIVDRRQMREELAALIALLMKQPAIDLSLALAPTPALAPAMAPASTPT